jgi:hypothetical protein
MCVCVFVCHWAGAYIPVYTPYMTVYYLVISLPKIPYIHRVGQNHIGRVYVRYS